MSEAYWKARYYEAERAFHELKSFTKGIPASGWCDNFRQLASMVHSLGRDVFWVSRCSACGECPECKAVENGQIREPVPPQK